MEQEYELLLGKLRKESEHPTYLFHKLITNILDFLNKIEKKSLSVEICINFCKTISETDEEGVIKFFLVLLLNEFEKIDCNEQPSQITSNSTNTIINIQQQTSATNQTLNGSINIVNSSIELQQDILSKDGDERSQLCVDQILKSRFDFSKNKNEIMKDIRNKCYQLFRIYKVPYKCGTGGFKKDISTVHIYFHCICSNPEFRTKKKREELIQQLKKQTSLPDESPSSMNVNNSSSSKVINQKKKYKSDCTDCLSSFSIAFSKDGNELMEDAYLKHEHDMTISHFDNSFRKKIFSRDENKQIREAVEKDGVETVLLNRSCEGINIEKITNCCKINTTSRKEQDDVLLEERIFCG